MIPEKVDGVLKPEQRKWMWCDMAKKSSFKIPGLSFSCKRAFGITKAKRKIAKATGIPTTKAGRRNKVGKILGIK